MADSGDFAERLEIFFGDANDAIAHVYARLRGPEAAAGLHLAGRLTGPACLYAETLPATFALVDRGPGGSLLAEALISEPCFWTPEMPHLYSAQVELRRDGDVLAVVERPFGIRALGARGRNMIFDGRRWVLRAVCADKIPSMLLSKWHQADAATMLSDPDDALCEEASRVGVLIVARLERPTASEIQRLGRWPAVALVALPGRATIDLQGLAHNLLLAQEFEPGEPIALATWADVAICHVGDATDFQRVAAESTVPVIAARIEGARPPDVTAGRALCDRLQCDLAGHVEISGYIV